MDIRKLKTILELFESSNLQEIEFSEGEEKIKLKKALPPQIVAAPMETVKAEPVVVAEPPVSGHAVKSPIVGTFYRASAPDKPSFVSVGQRVKEGDPLCIVEAMKLMNEIPSPVSGVVSQIFVENGEPVAYGTKLLIIE